MKNTDPSSLLNLQRQLILDSIKKIQKPGGLYSLVLDDKTESVVNQVISKENLLRIVASIEKLDGKRKKQSFIEAIYFAELNSYTIECMIIDVEANRYKTGHGLFLPFVEGEVRTMNLYVSNKFMKNPKVLEYFGNGSQVQFTNACFHPIETKVFLADNKTPNSMPIYFNPNCLHLVLPQIRLAAKALVNLMVLTGEYPLIRFFSPQDSTHKASRLSELIADEFQLQIDNYARMNPNFPPPASSEKPRSILLITDRTMDLYAPLLHEFTYQAMAMDIVESLERKGTYHLVSENEKGEEIEADVLLENEDDDDWVNLRHLHIIESSELIIKKINELIEKNPLLVDRTKATTSSDLMYVVAHLKGFDVERRQVTLHKSLIDECLEINAKRGLAEFAADFEQTCTAKGVTFEGQRNKNLADDLITLLAREDLHINEKMRLLLIYGIYRGGLCESDFTKLVKFIGVRDRQIMSLIARCFPNLIELGFPIVKPSVKEKGVKKKMFHTISNEGTYNTSRFGPGVKSVLNQATRYQLDEEWFPYFRDKPLEDDIPTTFPSKPNDAPPTSLRNPRIKASWAQPSTKVSLSLSSFRPKQRIFCYVAGGMTYSEMRSIYELSTVLNKDVYIGSECILKPRDFLIGLQNIHEAKRPEDLDLNLQKEITHPKQVPSELYENSVPTVAPSVQPSSSSLPAQNSPIKNAAPATIPKPVLASPPSSSASKDKKEKKEKKKSKFKRLFK